MSAWINPANGADDKIVELAVSNTQKRFRGDSDFVFGEGCCETQRALQIHLLRYRSFFRD